jgi:sterol desaturase/sphingolipid hydroxylase (fatty acid hydroxylase superfamily)
MTELQDNIINNESSIRLIFFFGIIFIMAILEYIIPKRKLLISKRKRWFNNIILVFLNTLLIRVLFPTAAVGIALFVENNSIGLFNVLELSSQNMIIPSIILLDLIIYWQHRLFHTINFFWKFHKVHHSDMDYDLTTGFRFHPIEIIMSILIKFFFIALFGIPVVAVVCLEIILSTLAIFNHSNINLEKKLDKILRYIIVTPDMHRIHHSIYNDELNSNYGFNISLWDRVFKSYTQSPKVKYEEMTIGLQKYQNENKTVSIFSILKLPFIKV